MVCTLKKLSSVSIRLFLNYFYSLSGQLLQGKPAGGSSVPHTVPMLDHGQV